MAASGVSIPPKAIAFSILLGAGAAGASETPPPAYQIAAQRADVPPEVLYAVALQETGLAINHRLVPWPWTINVARVPHRYNSQEQACDALLASIQNTPLTRIDVGLGQINLGYQQHRYQHPCHLLLPYHNLAIAADILREHHKPGDDWLIAIGQYHHPAGGDLAERYRQRVNLHLARITTTPNSSMEDHLP